MVSRETLSPRSPGQRDMNPPVPTAPKWVLLNCSSGQVQGKERGLRSKVALGFTPTPVLSGLFLRLELGPRLAQGSLAVLGCKTGK